MQIANFRCPDPEVALFLEREFNNISPDSTTQTVKTASQLFQAARDRFGDYRCIGLLFYEN
jgi:hypothetical protein